MASVKLVLRKEMKFDGTSPLALRLTKDRKTSYIYLDYSIRATDWNPIEQRVRKTYPNSARLNNYLAKKLSEATDSVLQTETEKAHVSSQTLREKIKPTAGKTFFSQAQQYLDDLRAGGKYNQYTADKPRIGHFKDFTKADIRFTEISIGLLDRFVIYLKSTYRPKRGSSKISDRTIANHLVVIRSVFAFARKNDVIDQGLSPFGRGKVTIKFGETRKVGISIENVQRLEALTLPEPVENHARNLWLFSFYLAGMRVSDVLRLRWADIQQDRLHYRMGKNKKVASLKIPAQAIKILQQYLPGKTKSGDLIFPELRDVDFENAFLTQRTIAFKTSAIDKCLRTSVAKAAQIDKPLTMHIARHTFASLAGDAIPIQMLQKLYRHSHVSTTIGYQQNFIHQDTDDALEAVIRKTQAIGSPAIN